MAGRFSVETVFKAVDRITAPVRRMQSSVARFARNSERRMRNLNKVMKATGDTLKTGARNTLVASGVFLAASANVVAAGSNFEQAITDVGAVSLQTREQVKPLEDLALSLGRTTKFTATQAANAMEVMARAGFKTNEIIAATPAVLSAAAASGLEIAEVADHVSNVMKGMGLESSEAARVADVLALASARTNSSIGSLGESMKNVSSTARKLNVPLEDVVAGVALLQDVGLDASVAGSAFNVMLTQMAKPSAQVSKIMRRLNLSFKDANGNMKPLPAVLAEINKATDAMGGNFDQVAFLAELVGLRGQKAAGNLGDLFKSGKTQALSKELQSAAGMAEKMADLRMDTLEGSMLLLGSAVDAVKVKIFGMNSGPLRDAVDKMTAWVGANEDLIASQVTEFLAKLVQELPTIAMWAKRIAIAVGIFATLSAIIKAATIAMTVFNAVVAINPIVLLVAAAVLLVVYIEEVVTAFDKMPVAIRLALTPLRLLLGAVELLKEALSSVWGMMDFSGVTMPTFGLFGGEERGTPQVSSPQDRIARSIEESNTSTSAEVTIKDDTGRAEVTRGELNERIMLMQTGGF